MLERESTRRREVVELFWCAVSDRPGPQSHASGLGELDELPFGALLAALISADREHHLIGGERAHRYVVAIAERLAGNEGLDHEAPAWGEMLCCRCEALSLCPDVGQIEERVVRDEDQLERADRHVDHHVPVMHLDKRVSVARCKLVEHGSARVDASDPDRVSGGCLSERYGESTRPNSEFKNRAVGNEIQEIGDRRVDVGNRRIPIVVDIGERIAIGSVAVAHHRTDLRWSPWLWLRVRHDPRRYRGRPVLDLFASPSVR